MKRRAFLGGLGAATMVPLLPTGALAGGGAPVSSLYSRAVQWAGMCEHSSPHILKYALGLDDTAAKELFGELVANKVVTAPDASGMSRVVVTKFHQHFGVAKAKNVSPPVDSPKPVARKSDVFIKDRMDTDSVEPVQKMVTSDEPEEIPTEVSNAEQTADVSKKTTRA